MSDLNTKRQQIKKDIRRAILISSHKARACHIGSALSCADILVDLFYNILTKEDVFIFAKASGAAAYYAVLADKGYFNIKKLAWFLKNYPLASKEVPGVIHSVGSVGMGLSVAVGLALSDRNRKVYCLISDGQLQAGVSYEAALFARHHNLTNLNVICDVNGLQACGRTRDILGLSTAISFFKKTFPIFQPIKTIKGAGVSFLENEVSGHYLNLNKELFNKALSEI